VDRKRKKFILGSVLLLVSLITTGIISACTSLTPVNLPPTQVRNFTLYVRDNFITMPDGKKIYVFGFTNDPNGKAQVPGPKLEVNEGDTVNLNLVDDKDPTNTPFNNGGDGHTIHLHGLDLPSQFDGDPMTQPGGEVKQGQHYAYHFVAKSPGTYWYHCHQEAAEHIQMGMYGAFIVHPRGELSKAYQDTPLYDKEYTFVLSDMDSEAHQTDYNHLFNNGPDTNWTSYHPNYFLINGKVWPDTMIDPNDSINATVGQKVLVRLINTGYVIHTLHSHGFHFQVIGTDGRKLDQPYYKDSLTIGSAERYEILFDLNQVGRYMFHDHVEQNTTNDGAYPGGMITMINVNKPDGTNPIPMPKVKPKD